MPPMPHSTVNHSGMLSRSPGAMNLPSRPTTAPPSSTHRIVSTSRRRSGADADRAGHAAADLDVRQARGGHQDTAARGVGQADHAVGGHGLGDGLLERLDVLVDVDDALGLLPLDAEFYLHDG